MHVSTSHAGRSAREPRIEPPQRIWTIHALQRISGFADDGVRTIVPTGTYILREIDEITYELCDSTAPPLLTLRLSEVAAYWRSGVLVIDGLWP